MRPLHTGLILAAWLVSGHSAAQVVLDDDARAQRDAARLANAAADAQADRRAEQSVRERIARTRERLGAVEAQRDELRSRADKLVEREIGLGDDLDQTYAVARTALTTLAAQIDDGPLFLDRSSLAERCLATAAASADVAGLYDAWFALHEAWLADGEIVITEAALTRPDGQRRATRITRYGALALATNEFEVTVDRDAGLVAAPSAVQHDRGAVAFARRLIDDGGAVGVAIGLCALAGLAVLVRTVRGRAGTGRDVALIRSAALLLGLLGTVVGLIHTFRGLARYGGGDVALAAAGIAHALATTALALVVAISLTLAHAMLRRRATPAAQATQRPIRRQTPRPVPSSSGVNERPRRSGWTHIRPPVALAASLVLTAALFFVMQWLTQRPLSEPPARRDTTVTRIDLPPPAPRRPIRPKTQRTVAAPSATTVAWRTPQQTIDAPPLTAPSLAVPTLDLPSSALSGVGGVPLAAGEVWQTGAAQPAFEGKDLVPISSARPRYPRRAREAGLDGFVDAVFEIDPDGRVRNIRIVDAEPPGVFEQAAADALARWLYAPFTLNGQPVTREATQRLVFDHRDARVTWQDDAP